MQKPSLSGTALKTLACVSMLLDHIGAVALQRGALAAGSAVWLWPHVGALIRLNSLLRCAGRLAFPLFCFLLTEGFCRTGSVRRYALRLAAFALVSEVPFDLAAYGTVYFPGHQNVGWTLLFGLGAMACLRARRQAAPGSARALCGTVGALACAAAAGALRTDYGAMGVLLIAALYLTREDRAGQCLAGAAVAALMQPAPALYALCAAAAFVPVWCYSGARGRCPRAAKWGFYLFYPAHLLALAGLATLLRA